MRNKLLFLSLAMCWCCSCSKTELNPMDATDDIPLSVSSYTHNNLEASLFSLINEHRRQQGLSDLTFEAVSYYYAKQHTEYMIAQKATSHDGLAERSQAISEQTGAIEVSENVAYGYADTASALEAWLNSPGHRANLEGNYTHSAIKIIEDADGRPYFTQIFWR